MNVEEFNVNSIDHVESINNLFRRYFVKKAETSFDQE